MTRKAYLHIGSEKTGSSYLQHFLAINRSSLARHGLIYPLVDGSENHSTLAMLAASPHLLDSNFDRTVAEANCDRLAAEIAAAPADATVILSSEHFHSRCTDYAPWLVQGLMRRLGLVVEGVLLFLRDQASLAQASYATAVLAGRAEPFSIAEVTPDNSYFNHCRTCHDWAKAFGQDRLRIASYSALSNDERGDNTLVRRFFSMAGVEGDAWDALASTCHFPQQRIHASLSASRSEILRLFNFLDQNVTLDRIGLTEHLRLLEPVADYSLMDMADIAFLQNLFTPLNNRMCRDFDLNPDDFPVACPQTVLNAHLKGKGQANPNDVARLALRLWADHSAVDNAGAEPAAPLLSLVDTTLLAKSA